MESGVFPLTCSAPLEILHTPKCVLAVWVPAPKGLVCCGWHVKLPYLLECLELPSTSGLYHLPWVLLRAVVLHLHPSPRPVLSHSSGQAKS